jgi:hypothetical protein
MHRQGVVFNKCVVTQFGSNCGPQSTGKRVIAHRSGLKMLPTSGVLSNRGLTAVIQA